MIFTSRIAGTAKDLRITIKAAPSAPALVALAAREASSCVIVDLGNPGLDIRKLISDLSTVCAAMPRVVAYGSHVDAAGLKEARDAGCDIVLPRSKFVEELPRALVQWMT
jgi:DNA-binding NarL/FixJ family response regulator